MRELPRDDVLKPLESGHARRRSNRKAVREFAKCGTNQVIVDRYAAGSAIRGGKACLVFCDALAGR